MTEFEMSGFLPFRLNRAADRFGRHLIPIYRDALGISRPEWRVLAHLGSQGPASASALAAQAALDKVKVSRAVARLERRGLLRREPHPRDGRVSVLTLTDTGRAAFDRLVPDMIAGQDRVLATLDPVRIARIRQALDDLEKALEAAGTAPAPADLPGKAS